MIGDYTFVFVSSTDDSRLLARDRRLLDVMAALIGEGAHVNLVCRPTSPLIPPARELDVEVAPYRLEQLNLVRTASRLRKYLVRYHPPVAHSIGVEANLLLRLAAVPLPVKVVNSLQCSRWPEYRESGVHGKATKQIDQRTRGRVDAFIVDCQELAFELSSRGVDASKLVRIVPGVHMGEVFEQAKAGCERPAPPATPVIAYGGRVEDARALDELCAAVDVLRASGVDTLVTATAECRLGPIAVRAREAGCLRVVDATLPALLSCADICCSVATVPGAAHALLIAGALGKPIVASAVFGVSELLEPGLEVTYVAPGDMLALADGIRGVLQNPERAARMAEAARHRVLDDYTAAEGTRRHLQLYRSLMPR